MTQKMTFWIMTGQVLMATAFALQVVMTVRGERAGEGRPSRTLVRSARFFRVWLPTSLFDARYERLVHQVEPTAQ